MSNDDVLFRFRQRVIALAQELGSVREACRVMEVHPFQLLPLAAAARALWARVTACPRAAPVEETLTWLRETGPTEGTADR